MNCAPTLTCKLHHAVLKALVACSCLFAFVAPGSAQDNPAAQVCGEIKDDDTRFQAELCSAHAGCRMVLGIQKTCTRTVEFLDRLKTSIGDGVQTLFGKRKEVQPENVVEASLSEEARRVAGDPAWKSRSDAVDKLTRQANRTELSGSNGSSNWSYVGDVKNGTPEGAGTLFFDSGDIVRGQFKNGKAEGQIDNLAADGMRRIGEVRDKKLNGDGLAILAEGTELRGQFAQGALNGEGLIKLKDGSRYEGQFNSGTLVDGKAFRPDGTLAEKGRFDPKRQLQVGEKFAADGTVTEHVDRPRQLAEAAAAKRQAAEDQKRLAEEQKQRDEALKKQAEAEALAAFQDQLGKLNPGQLFALADEMGVAGNSDRARAALRALISRFPDHALVGAAAQQLAKANAAATTGTGDKASGASGAAAKPVAGSATPSQAAATSAMRANTIEVSLVDRHLNVADGKNVVRVSIAEFEENERRVKSCQTQNFSSADCRSGYSFPYRYSIGNLDNPYKLGGRSGNGQNVQCKFTPGGYTSPDSSQQAPPVTCQALLLAAVHEGAETVVEFIRTGGKLFAAADLAPLPGAGSGRCKEDLALIDREAGAARARRPASATSDQFLQTTLFFAIHQARALDTSCKGQPQADGLLALKQRIGDLYRTCTLFKTDTSVCKPKMAY